jgi:hypothetical protein
MEPPLAKVGMMRMLTVLMAALAVAAALGCGSDDDQEAPTEQEAPTVSGEQRAILSTIDVLQNAGRQGGARKICNEIFTERLAESIPARSNRSCEKEVRETFASPDTQLSVGLDMDIRGSRATVTVLDEDGRTSRLFLIKVSDRWRIDRIKPVKS